MATEQSERGEVTLSCPFDLIVSRSNRSRDDPRHDFQERLADAIDLATRYPVPCAGLPLAECGDLLAAGGRPAHSLPGRNLATGRTATFSLAPNYSYSAGGDDTDLFDGKHVREGFWTNRGTVGWVFGRKPGVLISLDLGAVASIDAVSFDTAGGFLT